VAVLASKHHVDASTASRPQHYIHADGFRRPRQSLAQELKRHSDAGFLHLVAGDYPPLSFETGPEQFNHIDFARVLTVQSSRLGNVTLPRRWRTARWLERGVRLRLLRRAQLARYARLMRTEFWASPCIGILRPPDYDRVSGGVFEQGGAA